MRLQSYFKNNIYANRGMTLENDINQTNEYYDFILFIEQKRDKSFVRQDNCMSNNTSGLCFCSSLNNKNIPFAVE